MEFTMMRLLYLLWNLEKYQMRQMSPRTLPVRTQFLESLEASTDDKTCK
jgi:hypothetical protein